MIFFELLGALSEMSFVTLCRFRARLLVFRGAKIGIKTDIGPQSRFTKPWLLTMGAHVKLEESVLIKIVSKEATCQIGDHVFVGKGVELNVLKSVRIGSHVLLAPGVFIIDHNHQIKAEKRIDQQDCVADEVVIENDVWIGANAIILPGVTVGRGSVVAAGSVVSKDVPEMSVVSGVPAKLLKART